MRRASGFTLIEMVVTIGIIILAAGFLAPAIGTMFQSRKLDNAGKLITNVLNEARTSAVTRKQPYQVVFLKDGLRLYREPKGTDLGGFEGNLNAYAPDAPGTITYDLEFAKTEYGDIPDLLSDEAGGLPQESWKVQEGDITLRFLPEGTVDFLGHLDIPSYAYEAKPPTGADCILKRMGDDSRRGYVDIRPTGRSESKVVEVEE